MKELLSEMAEIRHIEEGHLEEDNIVMPPRKARCMAGMEHLEGTLNSSIGMPPRKARCMAGMEHLEGTLNSSIVMSPPKVMPPSKADWADWL